MTLHKIKFFVHTLCLNLKLHHMFVQWQLKFSSSSCSSSSSPSKNSYISPSKNNLKTMRRNNNNKCMHLNHDDEYIITAKMFKQMLQTRINCSTRNFVCMSVHKKMLIDFIHYSVVLYPTKIKIRHGGGFKEGRRKFSF